MRSRQTSLFDNLPSEKKRFSRTIHGGTRARGRRKLERPLSTKRPIHLILKSSKAKGKLSFLKPEHQIFIQNLIYTKAKRFGVRVADLANVGNHLHIHVRTSSRAAFQKFLKSISSLIARRVTGARRGKAFGRFWDALAYTRVLRSRIEELRLRGYLKGNRIEAESSRAEREEYMKQFNAWVRDAFFHRSG